MAAPDQRPDPDTLLARITEEEAKARRGRLKIFLGAAPGVGKTYTMLEAARQHRGEGTDVVAGVVETHGRAETERLLEGLEVLPRRTLQYRGTTLQEFDLDAALTRRPQLLLVDEMAHTNAPGSRHGKRWQDVEELLAAGIDVYTTVNIQHIESLNDVVAQITGIVVRETVPDAVLDTADEVELTDVTAEVLLERLHEGKVYVPEQAARAVERFFRRGNLIALRELALRRTADRVDQQMLGYRRIHGIQKTWPAADRILVCIGPNPASVRLIRAGARMAAALRAEWIVLHAERGQGLSDSDRAALTHNLRLAEQSGARVVTLSSTSVDTDILAFARAENVTRIIVGKPTHPRWRDQIFGSLLDRLIRGSGDIDVYVITGEHDGGRPATMRPARPPTLVREYVSTGGIVALTTALGFLLRPWFSPTDIAMTFLVAVMIVAVRYGTGPSLLASTLATAVFDFCFVPPYYTFAVADVRYLLTFGVMLAVALVISRLTARVRAQAHAAREREQGTAALYALSRRLAAARGRTELAKAVSEEIHRTLRFDAVVLVPADGALLPLEPDAPVPSDKERAVARWTFDHGKAAGRGTDTLAEAEALYVPMMASGNAVGVLRITAPTPDLYRDPIRRQLVDAVAGQAALAFEREALAQESQSARLDAEAEELRSSLLSSLSHDLRTPLGTIAGAASTLVQDPERLTPTARGELAHAILDETHRMMRLVSNLLDMVKVETGSLQVTKEWQSLEEVVGVALLRIEDWLGGRNVVVTLSADLPLIPMDGLLIEQVILNLLDNALKHAPEDQPIDVSAELQPDSVLVTVADRGPGLPLGAEERVFEKFYRVAVADGAGAGLGLAICRAIVAAHGGRIWAEARPGGGAMFRFTIPVTGPAPEVPEATEE